MEYSVCKSRRSTWAGRCVSKTLTFGNHIAETSAAFSRDRGDLVDHEHPKNRLKLFDVVITSTVVHQCKTYAFRVDQQKRSRALQRKMSRMVLSANRRTTNEKEEDEENEPTEFEPWQVSLKRTVRWTEDSARDFSL